MKVLFPGAVLAEQRVHFAGARSEVRAAQRRNAAEALRDGGSLKVHVAL